MEFRNLDKIRFIIQDATDLDIAYAYDDLVFPEHTAFIIQFDDKNESNYFLYFHEDCIGKDKVELFAKLQGTAKVNKCNMEEKGAFTLEQVGEEVKIHFN